MICEYYDPRTYDATGSLVDPATLSDPEGVFFQFSKVECDSLEVTHTDDYYSAINDSIQLFYYPTILVLFALGFYLSTLLFNR